MTRAARGMVRTLVPGAVALAVAAGVGAQAPAPDARARGLALMKATAEAMGGADRIAAVKDITVKGNVVLTGPMGEMKGESVAHVLYPDKLKSTVTLPMGQLVQAYDGKTAWVQMGGQTQEMPEGMAAEMERSINTSGSIGLVRTALDGSAEVEALDPGEVEGRKADVVLWKHQGQEIRLFLDADSHLVSKLAFLAQGPQGQMSTEVVATDYRDVNGVKIPFKVAGLQNGQKFLDLETTEVQINSGVEPGIFTKP